MTATARSLAVIGGTGFFGKSILDAFRRGLLTPWGIERVVAASRRPENLARDHPELLGPGVELAELDVTGEGGEGGLPRADYVIHAANTTDARAYAADPLRERAAILAGAERFVARAAIDCPDARIVYTSSGAVYGQQPAHIAGIAEEAPFAGADGLVAYKRDYAEAKRLSEETIARYGREQQAHVAIARCFAFVGPYLPRDQHFAIGNFLADGMAGQPIAVHARHPVIRSYMHGDDLARWLLTIADAATPACPVYNVGSDEGIDIADLAARIAARYGVPVHLPERGDGPVDRYVPSIARAAGNLGLRLEHDLDQALDLTIARVRDDTLVRTDDSATSHGRSAATSSPKC